VLLVVQPRGQHDVLGIKILMIVFVGQNAKHWPVKQNIGRILRGCVATTCHELDAAKDAPRKQTNYINEWLRGGARRAAWGALVLTTLFANDSDVLRHSESYTDSALLATCRHAWTYFPLGMSVATAFI